MAAKHLPSAVGTLASQFPPSLLCSRAQRSANLVPFHVYTTPYARSSGRYIQIAKSTDKSRKYLAAMVRKVPRTRLPRSTLPWVVKGIASQVVRRSYAEGSLVETRKTAGIGKTVLI